MVKQSFSVRLRVDTFGDKKVSETTVKRILKALETYITNTRHVPEYMADMTFRAVDVVEDGKVVS